MIELNEYIKKLLSENDIAIIPHFGGFLAHYIPAIRDYQSNLFIPPRRSIGFNKQLKLNDGLLIQSYMDRRNITFVEASELVKNDVTAIKDILEEKGYIKFDGIGTIYCDAQGNYTFEEVNTDLECPLYFGLAPFEMLELKDIQSKQHKQKPAQLTKGISLKENKRVFHDFLGGVAVLCMIITSLFIFSTPTENTLELSKENYAKILPLKIWEAPAEELQVAPLEKDPSLDTEEVNIPSTENTISTEATPTEDISPKTTDNNYHIIIASLIPQDKADALVSELIDKGFNSAKVLTTGGKRRVSIDAYSTSSEAQMALNKEIHPNYPSAWILKIK